MGAHAPPPKGFIEGPPRGPAPFSYVTELATLVLHDLRDTVS